MEEGSWKMQGMKRKAEDRVERKISVIIPVYNVAPYLRQCLDSVVGQTYGNLEIIVVDDGSTDGGGAICDSYAKKDGRITVIHQDNKGLSAARNTAMERMTGDLVGFVDSDDYLEPDFYEALERKIAETQADIVVTSFYVVYQDGRYPQKKYTGAGSYSGMEGLAVMEKKGLGHNVWNKLYRRSLWDGVRFPEGRVYEDVQTTWKTLLRARKVVCINERKYNYRVRKSSICNTPALTAQAFAAHWKLCRELQELERQGKVPAEMYLHFLECTVAWACRLLYGTGSRASKGEARRARELLKSSKGERSKMERKYRLMGDFPYLCGAAMLGKDAAKRLLGALGYKKLFP